MAVTHMSSEVLEARHERILAFLEDRNLGAIFVYSPPTEHKWNQTGHVSYLSGWANHDRIVDSAVVLPATGRPALLVGGSQYMLDQIARVSPLEDVRLVQAVNPNAIALARPDISPSGNWPRSFAAETLAVLQESGSSGKDVGVIGLDSMPLTFYEALSIGLGDKLRRVDDIVSELRSTKSPGEIDTMREAARLSDLGFEAMLKIARPGMRGIEVIAEMERAVRREGADHAKYWLAWGPPPDWSDVQFDMNPHERVLEEGALMASCSYVVYNGYWCHGHRAGTLVRPSAQLDRMHAIVRDVMEASLVQMRPGIPVGRVASAMREELAKHGIRQEEGRVGHGIGLDYSELPSPVEGNEAILQPGMTIAVHAGYPLPDPGRLGVPLGDVCHVTPEGPELLMGFPHEPFVAGV